MKKIFAMLLLSLVILNVNIFAKNIDFTDNVNITLNNQKVGKLDLLCAKNVNNRIMIKANNVNYCLGVNFDYNTDDKQILFTRIGKDISMQMDSNILKVNGEQLIMDCKPMVIEEYVYVPLKYLVEALDYKIEWNNKLKVVNINTVGVELGDYCSRTPLSMLVAEDISNISDKDIDYITKYNDLLNNMFPKGWEVAKTNKYLVEYFGLDEHMTKAPYLYTEWDIVFNDKENNNRSFVINNDNPMGYFIQNYILDNSKKYYEEYYINKYFSDDNINYELNFYFADEYGFHSEQYNKYIDSLENINKDINLCDLDVRKIYDWLPIYASIKLYYDTSLIKNDDEKQSKIDEIHEVAIKMINEINKDTNNKVNIQLFISSNSDDAFNDEKDYRDYFLYGSKYDDNPKAVIDMGFLTNNVYKDYFS